MKSRKLSVPKARTFDVPLPEAPTAEGLLAAKLGSDEAADDAILALTAELGVPASAPRRVLAAVALSRLGGYLEGATSSLDWAEFEEFCTMVISASGYGVRKNVRLRKPTRQIDIVAESPSLVLAIDCKLWRSGGGPARLEAAALAQAERTRLLMEKTPAGSTKAYLPVVLTVVDSQVRVLGGVPIVPLHRLKEFLASVNPFEEAFGFIVG